MNGMATPVDGSSPVSYTATIEGLFSDAAGLRLPAEAGLEGLVACEVGTQGLDRHGPVQPEVTGPVHLGHAAPADDTI